MLRALLKRGSKYMHKSLATTGAKSEKYYKKEYNITKGLMRRGKIPDSEAALAAYESKQFRPKNKATRRIYGE